MSNLGDLERSNHERGPVLVAAELFQEVALPFFSLPPPHPTLVLFFCGGGSEPGFDFLARRRPGMQDRGGVRVRRRMDKSKTVPTDQQPFNELQELKEDPLFGWAQEDFKVTDPP